MRTLSISVSKLTSFDDYVHGRWNQEDDARLVEYLTGRAEKTTEQSAGDAVHSFIESPQTYLPADQSTHAGVQVAGYSLSESVVSTCLTYRGGLAEPVLFEQWLPVKKVVVKGYEVSLRSRIDVLTPDCIRDIKTTDAALDYDRYAESYQWRYYLWLGAIFDLDTFKYDVFQWKNKGQVLKLNTITLHAYPSLEADCMALLTDFVDYVESRDLLDYCIPRLAIPYEP